MIVNLFTQKFETQHLYASMTFKQLFDVKYHQLENIHEIIYIEQARVINYWADFCCGYGLGMDIGQKYSF